MTVSPTKVNVNMSDNAESEFEVQNTQPTTNANATLLKTTIPWEAYRKYYRYISEDAKNIKAKCLLCVPKHSEISTSRTSATNFKEHITRVHISKLKELEEALKSPIPCKRAKIDSAKQASLPEVLAPNTRQPIVTQSEVDRIVIDYIVSGMRPFSDVDDPSFRNCVLLGLRPSLQVMSSKTLKKRLQEEFEKMKTDLKERLQKVQYVATTADCWSKFKRSFLGMTVHWIDEVTLERRSAMLTCRRILGLHTFDVLAKELDQVHKEYGIHNKTERTIRDNGSNFIKAFKEYSGTEEAGSTSTTNNEDEYNWGETTENVEITGLLDQGNSNHDDLSEIILPRHERCASHTLNRVAVKDGENANYDRNGAAVMTSAFKKIRALWRKQNSSTQIADIIQSILGRYLVTPTVTRWNSDFDSAEDIKNILDNKNGGEEKLKAIFDAAGLPRLTSAEINFIKEYCAVMGPLARALDILQGEKNVYQGYLLPTISSLEIILKELLASPLEFCKGLATAVLEGVQNRFESAKTDRDFIIASCTHPRFKLSWIQPSTNENSRRRAEEDKTTLKNIEKMIVEEIIKIADAECENSSDDNGSAVEALQEQDARNQDDFFRLRSPTLADTRERTVTEICKEEWKGFLQDETKEVSCLHKYPRLKKLFIRTNTPLPSSAPIERKFSLGGKVLRHDRARLGDDNFEIQLMLRANANKYQ